MKHPFFFMIVIVLAAASSRAADATARQFQSRTTAQPFLQTYCITCHAGEKPKGDFDLTPYSSVEKIAGNFKQWELVLEKIQTKDMPPGKAKLHPPDDSRAQLVAWIQALRKYEAHRNAG